jgi:magnesium chelatase family protein
MLIHSFVRDGHRLIPMEVELSLWPGLPGIQFLGLADQQIKESALRIKSAIKAQGFQFPKSQQILVNLRPSHLKKTSHGLELAVALAYLLESEQIRWPKGVLTPSVFAYGSLTLDGYVQVPEDFALAVVPDSPVRWLIAGPRPVLRPMGRYHFAELASLSELREPLSFSKGATEPRVWRRPALNPDLSWSSSEAPLLATVAAGEHHVLLAGPAGSGKTSMAQVIHQMLPLPAVDWLTTESSVWRPLVQPHHTVTLRAMIGGGPEVSMGEISRAHHGTLLLDEFLEMDSQVIESLREPMEAGVIRLARGARQVELPTRFQLMATSNLCPCGSWVPGTNKTRCRFTLKRCRSYGERMSGPLLDRFHILHFTKRNQEARGISSVQVLDQVDRATNYRERRGQKESNAWVPIRELESYEQKLIKADLLPQQMGSERRRIATLRVARTLADLDQQPHIQNPHLQMALQWSYGNFNQVTQWF